MTKKKTEDQHILNKTEEDFDINSVFYDDEPIEKHKAMIESVDTYAENLLPAPPKNTSDLTKLELSHLQNVTGDLSEAERSLVETVDKDSRNLFKIYAKEKGLDLPKDFMDDVFEKTDPITLKLKYYFKRARPEQIAEKMGFDVDVITTDTHQTPAYPSGHQTQGSLTALAMIDRFPQYEEDFRKMEDMVGRARVLQGVHYPSDNQAGKVLARKLWDELKSKQDE